MNGWLVSWSGSDPSDEGRREALCTLGNGLFATRGAAPERVADDVHYPGTYAAGVFNRLSDQVDGMTLVNESLVNLPNWLVLAWSHDDEDWFPSGSEEVLEHQVRLDLRHGTLTRRLRYEDPRGRRTRVTQQRFVHMAFPHLAGLHTEITPENWSGRLRVRSCIDTRVENTGVARYRGLSGRHLELEETRTVGDVDLVVMRTNQSRVRVAVGIRNRLDGRATGRGLRAARGRVRPGGARHVRRRARGSPRHDREDRGSVHVARSRGLRAGRRRARGAAARPGLPRSARTAPRRVEDPVAAVRHHPRRPDRCPATRAAHRGPHRPLPRPADPLPARGRPRRRSAGTRAAR